MLPAQSFFREKKMLLNKNSLLYPASYELLPWEPEIGESGYGFTMGVFTPNEGDECEECGLPLPVDFPTLVSTGSNAFCSFECLQKRAKKYPSFYKVVLEV